MKTCHEQVIYVTCILHNSLDHLVFFRCTIVRLYIDGQTKIWPVFFFLLTNHSTVKQTILITCLILKKNQMFCVMFLKIIIFMSYLKILSRSTMTRIFSLNSKLAKKSRKTSKYETSSTIAQNSAKETFTRGVFHVYLMRGLQKNVKKYTFFFKSTLSVLRCTWTGRIRADGLDLHSVFSFSSILA